MALVRILSINLLTDRADPDDLRRVIVEADPDVVCAQELGPSTATVIEDLLPHGHLDPREDLFGLGIATRYPVAVVRLLLAQRSGWIARLDPGEWPGISRPLDVFDVHLVNPIDRPWRGTSDVRRRQVNQITATHADRDVASVVIGDMNATPAWRAYKALTALGEDAALATGTAARTWAYTLFGPRLLRIDHAFVSGVQPISTSTVRIKGTDHRALIVDVGF